MDNVVLPENIFFLIIFLVSATFLVLFMAWRFAKGDAKRYKLAVEDREDRVSTNREAFHALAILDPSLVEAFPMTERKDSTYSPWDYDSLEPKFRVGKPEINVSHLSLLYEDLKNEKTDRDRTERIDQAKRTLKIVRREK